LWKREPELALNFDRWVNTGFSCLSSSAASPLASHPAIMGIYLQTW
jgi:hypothetical protein